MIMFKTLKETFDKTDFETTFKLKIESSLNVLLRIFDSISVVSILILQA
jgi:hypothetical protein